MHAAPQEARDHYDRVYLNTPLGAVLGVFRCAGPKALMEGSKGAKKWKSATRFKLVSQLLDQNADPNYRPNESFNTPLHQALHWLAYNHYEDAALASAGRKESAAIVQLLCSKGANTKALRDEMTPWQMMETDRSVRASIDPDLFTTLNKLYQPYRPKASKELERAFHRLDQFHEFNASGQPLEVFVAKRLANIDGDWIDVAFPKVETSTHQNSLASAERKETLGRLIVNVEDRAYRAEDCLVEFGGEGVQGAGRVTHLSTHRIDGQAQTLSVLLETLHALSRGAPDCDEEGLSQWLRSHLCVLLAGALGGTDARSLAPFGLDESLHVVHAVAEMAYVLLGHRFEFDWCFAPDALAPKLNTRPPLPPSVTMVGTLLCRLHPNHVFSALLALRAGLAPLDCAPFHWRPSGTFCETPLMQAVLAMRPTVAIHLLDRGADPWAEHGELLREPTRPYDAAVAAEAACTELARQPSERDEALAALDAWTGVVAIMNATPSGGFVRREIVLEQVPTEQQLYDEIQRSVLADLFRIFEPHLFDDQALEPFVNLLAARWEAYAKRIYAAKTKEIASELGKTLNEEALEVVAVLDETQGAILPRGWSRIATLLGIRSGT